MSSINRVGLQAQSLRGGSTMELRRQQSAEQLLPAAYLKVTGNTEKWRQSKVEVE